MAEKPLTCASCGGDLEAAKETGRPATYCSEPCRRFAEYQIRSLTRRIDRYEIEEREVQVATPGDAFYCTPGPEREKRLRVLREWLAADNRKLRALLGQKAST